LRHPPLHFYQGMPAKKDFVVPEFAALEFLSEQARGHPVLLLEGAQLLGAAGWYDRVVV